MASNLYLYGPVAEKFGAKHTFEVDSLSDCIVMLQTQFSKAELKKEFSMHDFELIRNDDELNKDDVKINFSDDNEFHLIPVAMGASDKGIFNIIAGIVLIAVSFYIPPAGALGYGILTAGTVGMFGVGLLLSGIGMVTNPVQDDITDRNQVDERPSYVFNGPVNSTEQGGVVPIGFGEFICGSIVIASELQNEDI